MIDYTLQIDLSGGKHPDGYFTISVIKLDEMTSEYVNGNPRVERRGFGEIQVKNEPYKYQKLGGDRYNLYDIISSVLPSQEIHLKFTSTYETLYAYFGIIDCKLDDDKNIITIKPYILDQYTDLIENDKTEVSLFDESNQIVNGEFKYWTDNNPNAWTKNTAETVIERDYFNDESCIALPLAFNSLGLNEAGINTSILNVLPNKNVSISFNWALTGNISVREDLKCMILLIGAVNSYVLDINGKWKINDYSKITYKPQALPIPETSAQYNRFSLLTEYTPEFGSILVYFYHYSDVVFDEATSLKLTDIVVSVSSIELKTVKIKLNAENLVTRNEDAKEIFWTKRKPRANFYSTKFDYQKTLDSFFDGNGKPIESELIMSDDNGIQIRDIIQFFQDQSSISYKYELSRIDIFKCEYIAHKKRRFRAICEFTREEIYYQKYDDGNGGYLPPEEDSGWFNTGITDSTNTNRLLWVRTPFNGTAISWIKSAVNTTGKWREYKGTFGYHDSITAVKNYPVSASSEITVSNAVSLREVFRKVYTETHISLRGKNVYSNFLFNDSLSAEEEALVYLKNPNDANYVTITDSLTDSETKNELNSILAVHTYEFSTEATTDKEKTILKTTFSDLMADFLALFPECYWFIDSNGNLHIEHVKYFDRVNVAKDITGTQYDYLGQYQNWEYIKDQLFSLETYEFKNSGNPDFYKSEVSFDKIVSNKRGQDIKNEISGSILSTDIKYCIENRNSLDNGIVLIAYDVVSGENICRYGVGQKTRKSVVNGDLSIASLLAKYATYEGVWQEGRINNQGFWNSQDTYKFNVTKYTRQGAEITIKGVFLDKVILSKLGIGIVNQRKIDYENSITKLVALYRHSDNYLVLKEDDFIDYGGDIPIEKTIPEVLTVNNVTSINDVSAVCSGNIVSNGNDTISECGILVSLNYSDVNIDNGTKFVSGTNSGVYSVGITGLSSNNNYYFRAYAINSKGIAYGDILSFQTLNYQVSIYTGNATDITETTANVPCYIAEDGGSPITERGLVWSLLPNPTIGNNIETDGDTGTGNYIMYVTNLPTNSTFYMRAYAINSSGVFYGNAITFTN